MDEATDTRMGHAPSTHTSDMKKNNSRGVSVLQTSLRKTCCEHLWEINGNARSNLTLCEDQSVNQLVRPSVSLSACPICAVQSILSARPSSFSIPCRPTSNPAVQSVQSFCLVCPVRPIHQSHPVRPVSPSRTYQTRARAKQRGALQARRGGAPRRRGREGARERSTLKQVQMKRGVGGEPKQL